MPLPTRAEMFAHALEALEHASCSLSDARDWLKSDWRPAGSSLSDAGARARRLGLEYVSDVKGEIEEVKQLMREAIEEAR